MPQSWTRAGLRRGARVDLDRSAAREQLSVLAPSFRAAAGSLVGDDLEPAALAARAAALAIADALDTAASPLDVVAAADACGADRGALADAVSVAIDYVADRGAEPDAWAAMIELAGHLHPSGCWRTEPRQLLEDDLLAAFIEEVHASAERGRPLLVELCESEAVAAVATAAAGRPLAPNRIGYLRYDAPGTAEPIHVDVAQYPYVLHAVVEHVVPAGTVGSRLVVHTADGAEHYSLAPGEAVVLAGRGTLHEFERLAEGEHRYILCVGLDAPPHD